MFLFPGVLKAIHFYARRTSVPSVFTTCEKYHSWTILWEIFICYKV